MFFIATRKAKSDYVDSNIENCEGRMTHIRYIDGNNLYGSQMLFDLPIEGYKFEDQTFTKNIDQVRRYSDSVSGKSQDVLQRFDVLSDEGRDSEHQEAGSSSKLSGLQAVQRGSVVLRLL